MRSMLVRPSAPCDIASKQRIGLPPVGAIVVEHPALRQRAGTRQRRQDG